MAFLLLHNYTDFIGIIMKNFNYTDTGDKIKPGDKIIIEMSFPQKFSFVGRADSVFKKLLEDNNAKITKSDKE